MLTAINDRGETGFLYFKDAQLIEVNLGAKWGQEAFTMIFYWRIVRFSIGELPAGIKRTIWDSIEKMIELAKSSPPPDFSADARADYVKRFEPLPGFVALYEEEDGQTYRMAGRDHEAIRQMVGFAPHIQELGQVLGAGALKSFYIRTPQFQSWRMFFQERGKTVVVFADAHADVFEAKMKEIC